jgi:predicted outer membrane repeat protein
MRQSLVWFLFLLVSSNAWAQLTPLAPAQLIPFTGTVPPGTSGPVQAAAVATIRYVKAGASGSGASWSNASGDLQATINASASGDQVWIAGGTYKPSTTGLTDARTAAFSLKAGVGVLGGFTGIPGTEGNISTRTAIPSSTTLSGDIGAAGNNTDNCYHVIFNAFSGGLTNATVLDGVVVTGGNANGSNLIDQRGGGIILAGDSPQFANCIVAGNTATDVGGGMYYQQTTGIGLTNCRFVNNSSSTSRGGGVGFIQCSGNQVINCSFSQNTAAGLGGGLYSDGSANADAVVNCFFSQNSASAVGGGGFASLKSPATLTNATFSGNTTGGVMYVQGTTVNLVNSLLWNNGGSGAIHGGVVNVSYSLLEVGANNYTDGGNNKTATFLPFTNATGPALVACAPAIDAGNNAVNTTTTDVLGNARRVRTIDIGAAEFTGTPYAVAVMAQASTTTLCVGSSTSLQATPSGSPNTPYSYTWIAPAGATLSSTSQNPTSATATSAGVLSFSVNVADALGCPATATVSVTANALPTLYTVTGGGAYCAGGTGVAVGLSSSQTGVTYQLLLNGNPVGGSLPGTGSALSFGNQTAGGTYTVLTTNTSTGCQQTMSGSAMITVNPSPTPSLANNGPLSCTMTSVTLTASGGTSYTFTDGSGTVLAGSGNTRTVSSPGTYSVTAANDSGCTSSTSTTVSSNTVVVVATLSATPSTTLTCAQTSLTLTAGGGNAYAFSGPGVVSQSGNQAVVSETGVYSVTATNTATGCFSTTSITISQDVSMPMASLTSSGTLTCSVTSVTLTASPSAQTYQFSPGAAQIGATNQATVSSPGLYSVTVVYGNGCSSVASVSVSQDVAMPMVSISASPGLTINQGQSTTLTANVSGGTAPFTYAWSTGANSNSIVVNLSGPYSVTATGANGCSGSASTTVTVSGPFAITGVTTVSCDPIQPNRFSVSFNPRYQGLNGQPVSFSVTNELFPTTQPGPYNLQLYSDNPTITLNAVQSGVSSSFVYHWLAACNSSTSPNTPPRVVMGIPSQTATVGTYVSYVIPDGTFTDDQTPGSLKLSAASVPAGLSFMGATLSGTPSTTVGSPFSITITATDPGGLSASTPLVLTVQPANGTPPPTMPFAITGVTTISCTPVANRISLSFAPRYAGMSGQSIAFEVVNELAPTTDPAPYSLTLYRDNPVITLRATQTGSPGPVTFQYNWLAACTSAGQENTPPRLNEPVNPQSATVGIGYSLNLINTFTDQETPNQITLASSALPAGLTLSGKMISGTPSMSGVTSVTLTATDGGGLSTSTSFTITVSPGATTPPPTATFSITGVTTVSCEVLSAGQRRVTFSPRYGGVNGGPISFSVVNELTATTNQGPYSLNLYTDNPVITLSAVQSGVSSQFSYGWLAACNAGARQAAVGEVSLSVVVLGNPVSGGTIRFEVRGAEGQPLRLSLTNMSGTLLGEQRVEQAATVERQSLTVGQQPAGVLLLQVSTPTQSRIVKVLRGE